VNPSSVARLTTFAARSVAHATPILGLLLAGCAASGTPAPTAAPELETAPPSASGVVVASAEVLPELEAHLSFVIAGTVREIMVQEGDSVQAGQTLMALNAPALEYAVQQAEAAARAAEFEYQYWVPARLDRPPERRLLAEQVLRQAERALDVTRARALQAVLSAPFDGVVVSIDVSAGELVQPSQIVLTLASLDRLQIVTTDLSERDVTRLAPGQPALISIDALGREFAGSVLSVAPKSETVGGDVVFEVTVEFDSQPPELLWGMSAEIQVDAR
jgi:RND family efflux transporter MFP subunit